MASEFLSRQDRQRDLLVALDKAAKSEVLLMRLYSREVERWQKEFPDLVFVPDRCLNPKSGLTSYKVSHTQQTV